MRERRRGPCLEMDPSELQKNERVSRLSEVKKLTNSGFGELRV